MTTRILVTKPIPDEGLDLLRPHATLDIGPAGQNLTAAELRARVSGVSGILCFVSDPLDADVLAAAAPTCRIVASFGVGTDNIDVATATRLGIQVTNTPDVLTDATADLTFALLLAVARQLPAAERLARSGTWTGIEPLQIFGCDVTGKTLGLIGAGRIGTAVGLRATGFRMPILYHRRSACPTLDAAGAQCVPLDVLLAESDFVSLHVPLTADTQHLIAAPQLRRMKPTAYLINTSRGAVVNEGDLIAALRAGTIAGAGLDVFTAEPRIPPELLAMPNVVCLPHIGSATQETRAQMAAMAATNLLAGLEGRRPPNPVNELRSSF